MAILTVEKRVRDQDRALAAREHLEAAEDVATEALNRGYAAEATGLGTNAKVIALAAMIVARTGKATP